MKKILAIVIVAVIIAASVGTAALIYYSNMDYSIRTYDGYYMDLRNADSIALIEDNSASLPTVTIIDDTTMSARYSVGDSSNSKNSLYTHNGKGGFEKVRVSKEKDNFDNTEEFDCNILGVLLRGDFLFVYVNIETPNDPRFDYDKFNSSMLNERGYVTQILIYLISLETGRIFDITGLFYSFVWEKEYSSTVDYDIDKDHVCMVRLSLVPLYYTQNEMYVSAIAESEYHGYETSKVGESYRSSISEKPPTGVYKITVNDDELKYEPILPTNGSVYISGMTKDGIFTGYSHISMDTVEDIWWSTTQDKRMEYDSEYILFDGYLCKDIVLDGHIPVSCTRLYSDGTTEDIVYGYEDLKQYVKNYGDSLINYQETDDSFTATYCEQKAAYSRINRGDYYADVVKLDLVNITVKTNLDAVQNSLSIDMPNNTEFCDNDHYVLNTGNNYTTCPIAEFRNGALSDHYGDLSFYFLHSSSEIMVESEYGRYLQDNTVYWLKDGKVKYLDIGTWEGGDVSGEMNTFKQMYMKDGFIHVEGTSDRFSDVNGVINGNTIDLSYKEPSYRILTIYSLN